MNVFDQFMTDEVTLKKQNGSAFSGIKASVQKGKIFIDDASLPIEEGDRLVRKLQNGLEESYVVVERGYCEAFHGLEAHYQCEVQRESAMQYKQWASHITYNIHGANSRVNIGSTDNSSNVVNINSDNVFNEIRMAINNGSLPQERASDLLKLVDDMDDAKGSPSFVEKYKKFIEVAANHMSVVAPFIPALTKFFG